MVWLVSYRYRHYRAVDLKIKKPSIIEGFLMVTVTINDY
jgi:hypothetical protein